MEPANELSRFERAMEARLREDSVRLRQRIAVLRGELAPVAPDCALGRQGRIETQAYQAVRGRELQAAQAALQDTEAALARLQHGRYGQCVRCGESIEPERLRARPQSSLCGDCAR